MPFSISLTMISSITAIIPSGSSVTNPAMNPTPTTIYPKYVVKAKILCDTHNDGCLQRSH